jgi:uncharacterized phage infection (PIP) family protein YhgE
MKTFNALFLMASVLVVATNAAITKPERVLEQIDEIKSAIATYQTSVQDEIGAFRKASSKRTVDFYHETLNSVETSIKQISATDDDIRAKLNAETQGACITNLNNYVDSIIELSGYAISDCLEVDDVTTVNMTAEFTAALDAFEREVNFLSEIAINALIGRNVFTQGDKIVARIQEQLSAKTADYTEKLNTLLEKAKELQGVSSQDSSTLDTCTKAAGESVSSGTNFVDSQLQVCARFGSRGARSVLPDPKRFFPQL